MRSRRIFMLSLLAPGAALLIATALFVLRTPVPAGALLTVCACLFLGTALWWLGSRQRTLRRIEAIAEQIRTARGADILPADSDEDEVAGIVRTINALKEEVRSGAAALVAEQAKAQNAALLLEQCSLELQAKTEALASAQEKADTANRAQSEFLANMSHEIRTPMTAILGYADLLAEPSTRTDERKEYISTIRRNSEYLLAIVSDILDFSKIDANHLVLQTAEVSIAQIVEEVIQSFKLQAQAKTIALQSDIRFPLPRSIAGDPQRFRQILANLVGNAIKFTEAGSVKVSLSYDKYAGAVRCDVADTGIGLSEEQINRIFQPFTQIDSAVSRKFGGTGLGLAISQRLVRMMGGDISIQSVPGRGSTFSFSLPAGLVAEEHLLKAPARQENAARVAEPQLDLSGFGARVLLAEDGPDNQRLISFLLRKAGLSVVIAENGRIAIEKFERAAAAGDPFDLIFMDMQMPVLDGYNATREMRAKGTRTPIIALTAHAMSTDREKCLNAGCDDYASKPIDRAALLALCERYLSPKSSLRAA